MSTSKEERLKSTARDALAKKWGAPKIKLNRSVSVQVGSPVLKWPDNLKERIKQKGISHA